MHQRCFIVAPRMLHPRASLLMHAEDIEKERDIEKKKECVAGGYRHASFGGFPLLSPTGTWQYRLLLILLMATGCRQAAVVFLDSKYSVLQVQSQTFLACKLQKMIGTIQTAKFNKIYTLQTAKFDNICTTQTAKFNRFLEKQTVIYHCRNVKNYLRKGGFLIHLSSLSHFLCYFAP